LEWLPDAAPGGRGRSSDDVDLRMTSFLGGGGSGRPRDVAAISGGAETGYAGPDDGKSLGTLMNTMATDSL
jgi:hypothetical protein